MYFWRIKFRGRLPKTAKSPKFRLSCFLVTFFAKDFICLFIHLFIYIYVFIYLYFIFFWFSILFQCLANFSFSANLHLHALVLLTLEILFELMLCARGHLKGMCVQSWPLLSPLSPVVCFCLP